MEIEKGQFTRNERWPDHDTTHYAQDLNGRCGPLRALWTRRKELRFKVSRPRNISGPRRCSSSAPVCRRESGWEACFRPRW